MTKLFRMLAFSTFSIFSSLLCIHCALSVSHPFFILFISSFRWYMSSLFCLSFKFVLFMSLFIYFMSYIISLLISILSCLRSCFKSRSIFFISSITEISYRSKFDLFAVLCVILLFCKTFLSSFVVSCDLACFF